MLQRATHYGHSSARLRDTWQVGQPTGCVISYNAAVSGLPRLCVPFGGPIMLFSSEVTDDGRRRSRWWITSASSAAHTDGWASRWCHFTLDRLEIFFFGGGGEVRLATSSSFGLFLPLWRAGYETAGKSLSFLNPIFSDVHTVFTKRSVKTLQVFGASETLLLKCCLKRQTDFNRLCKNLIQLN